MNRFKYLSVVLFAAMLAGVVVSCKNNEPDPVVEGKNAGTEMCGCVASFAEPNVEVPAGVNPLEPDLEDPVTLEYFAAVDAAYSAYFAELAGCAGKVAGKNQKYFLFIYENYNAEEGFFSVFDFKDENFKNGFLETANVCAAAFAFQ